MSFNRKFADIEAANHRLAAALYLKEEGENLSSLSSQEPQTLDQSDSSSRDPGKSSVHTAADGISKSRSDASVGSHETEISEKQQPESGHLWKRHPKTQTTTCNIRKNNQSKTGQKEESRNHKLVEFTSMSSPKDYQHRAQCYPAEYYDNESPLKSANNLSEDSEITQQDSASIQFGQNVDISPVFSPGLCPLSLDSCDFSIQMFTDIPTCTQAQKNIADVSESQWTDVVDLFSVGDKNLGGYMDVEAYFESICACQGDAGQEVGAGDFGFADQSDSFTEKVCSNRSEGEYLHCETGEYVYEDGYSCQGVELSQCIIQNPLPTSISYQYDVSELQTYQHPQGEGPCMLVNNQNFTPFEGVAQSFTVPLHNVKHCPIPTPPHEDDWLFTDILKERTSPDC